LDVSFFRCLHLELLPLCAYTITACKQIVFEVFVVMNERIHGSIFVSLQHYEMRSCLDEFGRFLEI